MPSDTFFGSDPTNRPYQLSDIFTNARLSVDGDVWYGVIDESNQDIAWTIVHENNQDIAWGISTYGITQDISWNVYARILYFIQQFNLKAICFGYNIKEPVLFNKQIVEPLGFAFHPTSRITDTAYLHGEVFDTLSISSPVEYNFQIERPVQFDFGTVQVLKEVQGSFSIRAVCFDYKIKEPIEFSRSIAEQLEWTFRSTGVITDTAYLQGEVFDTFNVSTPTTFDFQITNPVQFTFGLKNIQHGDMPG